MANAPKKIYGKLELELTVEEWEALEFHCMDLASGEFVAAPDGKSDAGKGIVNPLLPGPGRVGDQLAAAMQKAGVGWDQLNPATHDVIWWVDGKLRHASRHSLKAAQEHQRYLESNGHKATIVER